MENHERELEKFVPTKGKDVLVQVEMAIRKGGDQSCRGVQNNKKYGTVRFGALEQFQKRVKFGSKCWCFI